MCFLFFGISLDDIFTQAILAYRIVPEHVLFIGLLCARPSSLTLCWHRPTELQIIPKWGKKGWMASGWYRIIDEGMASGGHTVSVLQMTDARNACNWKLTLVFPFGCIVGHMASPPSYRTAFDFGIVHNTRSPAKHMCQSAHGRSDDNTSTMSFFKKRHNNKKRSGN